MYIYIYTSNIHIAYIYIYVYIHMSELIVDSCLRNTELEAYIQMLVQAVEQEGAAIPKPSSPTVAEDYIEIGSLEQTKQDTRIQAF